MGAPRIAVISFPGHNCEVESLRAVKNAGMEALYFRWNDDREKLKGIDGYFIPGGFTYEDRGRSGMVAARDSLMEFIGREAEEGKVIIGNCNGAQILVESGLVPLGHELMMSLARNAVRCDHDWEAPGFINEWVWITTVCARDRCATSDWTEGGEHRRTMHLPLAHGEGRFVTRDKDLLHELKKNEQIAFHYCNADGRVSDDSSVTPNGSTMAIAGICNPAGNVVALMPHPERTPNGAPYFASMRRWIEAGNHRRPRNVAHLPSYAFVLEHSSVKPLEIFIGSIIVNNEERTVEQAARRVCPDIQVKQWKYAALSGMDPREYLRDIAVCNPNKERAFIRRNGKFFRWHAESSHEEALMEQDSSALFTGLSILRRDEPDTGASGLPSGSETGVCYTLRGIEPAALRQKNLLQVFANPHASVLTLHT